MAFKSWILPLIIGIVCVIFLMSILYPEVMQKQQFTDLGAVIQLETSRPYIGVGYVPNVTYTTPGTDLSVPYPVYNYYPQSPLNPPTYTEGTGSLSVPINSNDNHAFINQPSSVKRAHNVAYYGGYPYPLPKWIFPATNIDNVKGVEDKI